MASNRRLSGEETRRRILEGAIVLLGRAGPAGFSASSLAAEVGVSKSTLFHHFPNLQQIPLEAFDMMNEAVLEWTPSPDASLSEVLDTLGARYMELMDEQRSFLAAQLSFVNAAIFDQASRHRVTQMLEQTVTAIATGLIRVGVGRVAARRYARMLVALLDGLGLHHLSADVDPAEIAATWKATCRLIIEAEKRK